MNRLLPPNFKTITEVSAKSQDKQALEQRNRELHNRSDNMKEEVAAMKAPSKGSTKDLAAERTELAELKKYDPQRLRKNLDASKGSWPIKPMQRTSYKKR